jgi:5-histidylcysteine sulfoxide synthase
MKLTKRKQKIGSMVPDSLKNPKRADLKEYFDNAWSIYEELFHSIKTDETYFKAPDPLRNPLIFYYGHTAVFYINKLELSGLLDSGINAEFELLFARGVDPELPEDQAKNFQWPSVNEVREYRKEVYELVLNVIEMAAMPIEIQSSNPLWNLHMAIEHDRIHFETSSVLIRQLDVDLVKRPNGWEYAPTFGFSEEFELVNVDAGKVTLGKQEPSDLFGWDNEFGQLTVDVKSFAATKNMITNGEFIHFVRQGGYNNNEYWTEEALDWKSRTHTSLPKFWLEEDENLKYRAMFDVIDMPLDWPVEVNAHEAKAYCKFRGSDFRLLSEAEFKLLTNKVYQKQEPALSDVFNLNIKYGSPTPVGFLEANEGELFNDLYGNVWDWLSDNFYPLPDFKEHDHYKDFSSPYFDDKHSMLLGGSWSTTGAGASQYYRLWFRDYFYQHAGFRLAKDVID